MPGYVDYGVDHGAVLMIDIEDGRFVFFYLAVDIWVWDTPDSTGLASSLRGLTGLGRLHLLKIRRR